MGRPAIIHKSPADLAVPPNLADYAAACHAFSWDAARRELAGLPGGGLNIAHEAVDRHAQGQHDISYRELSRLTNRFANVLKTLGIQRGERVFVLTGRIPELYTAVLGCFKNGCVVLPLFSAFGPEPLVTRLKLGEGAVLVSTDGLYERKVAKVRAQLPALRQVLLVSDEGQPTDIPGTHDLAGLMTKASEDFDIVATQPDDPALLHFTSGTTGTPRGAMHVHGAVVTHWATGRYALDLHPEDIFWCTADPGWVTGTPTALSRRCCMA
ncbi:MAG: AMP-binding protein [Polaromonas sp.]